MNNRIKSLEEMLKVGYDPYGNSIKNSINLKNPIHIDTVRQRYSDTLKGLKKIDHTINYLNDYYECVQGRIMLSRPSGKICFLTIRDSSGDIQVCFRKNECTERQWNLQSLFELGDIIIVYGNIKPTQRGELSVWPSEFCIASKSLELPPEKHNGLVDIDQRYRQRYVDLHNPKIMNVFIGRSKIISELRRLIIQEDFLEVETPILQTIIGGAIAKPFVTHHNALDIPMFMRIAPELYLKKLLVGGIEKVFEIGRNFRNEGISTKHNPEFTILELYWAYATWEEIASLAEYLIRKIENNLNVENKKYDNPFDRITMKDLVKKITGNHIDNPVELLRIYESECEKTLIYPTFVTHPPAFSVPLAKSFNGYAESFELVIEGIEIGCGYTEQTDPEAQIEAFKVYGGQIDDSFVHALRVGMPPSGGLGIGIDRLVMLLLEQKSIRDVILFPTMKPKEIKDAK